MTLKIKTLHVVERRAWRAWLRANGEKEKEIWLIFYKKHTGKKRLAYDDAVEEAICFGWIDSIVRRLDEKRYAQKFTPRKRGSKWSDLNIRRAKKMIAAGCMTPAGSILIEPGTLRRRPAKPKAAAKEQVPAYFHVALEADPKARAFFAGLAPSCRKLYVSWVDSAQKEETRQRRLAEAIATLRAGRKLGMK